MKNSPLTSRPASLVCPFCETGQLPSSSHDSTRCQSYGGRLSGAVLHTLQQLTGLPDALGNHPCECGHLEISHLPDGICHCPACGSEVLLIDALSTPEKLGEYSVAYWAGWVDGRFGESSNFVDNPNLARLEDPYDRLDYYSGHRAGREAGPSGVIDAETLHSRRQDSLPFQASNEGLELVDQLRRGQESGTTAKGGRP